MPESPLAGQRVVITRARHQAAALADAFAAAGAQVAFLPLLEVAPPDDPAPLDRAAAELASWSWLAFTSANAADAFLPRISALPEGIRVAVVGHATARAARDRGIEPAVVARQADAEGLVAAMAPWLRAGARVLVPQADDARPVLAEGLRALGAEVTTLVAYTKRCPPGSRERAAELFDDAPLGWVSFTSPRIVRHFVELFGDAWPARRGELRAVSIGRVTSAELRRQGVERLAEAASPSPAGMVAAACALAGRLRSGSIGD